MERLPSRVAMLATWPVVDVFSTVWLSVMERLPSANPDALGPG